MQTIRVLMQNNSDARECKAFFRACPALTSITAVRHNGGKVVLIDVSEVEKACVWLDSVHGVLHYTVQS